MEGEMFVYGSISVITEASKVFLAVLQYLAEKNRFEREMSRYPDKFAEILCNPDKYAVFSITGDLQNADELRAMLVKAGMDPDKITQFDENDQLLCVNAEDKELFNEYLRRVQEMDPLEFEIDDTPEKDVLTAAAEEYLPRIRDFDPQYIVDQDGNFRAITDREGNPVLGDDADVIKRYDSYGHTMQSYQREKYQGRNDAIQEFINTHTGVYCLTPNGNMIDRTDINPDGTYDVQNVIALRDRYGTVHFENGAAELGLDTARKLRSIKKLSFKTCPGGFVSRRAQNIFIPAIDPKTGDYYDYPSRQVVLSPYTLPPKTDPAYENICAARREAVLKRAYDLDDHTEPFYLDKDGNMTTRNPHDKDKTIPNAVRDAKGKVQDIYISHRYLGGAKLGNKPEAEPFVVILADEYGSYKKDGKEYSGFLQDEEENLGEERADDLTEDQQEEEEKEEDSIEGEEEAGEEQETEEFTEEEDKSESGKKKKRKQQKSNTQEEQSYEESEERQPEVSVPVPETAEQEVSETAAEEPAYTAEPAYTQEAAEPSAEPESRQEEPEHSAASDAGQTQESAASEEVHTETAQAEQGTPSAEEASHIEEAKRQEENARTAEHNRESADAEKASSMMGSAGAPAEQEVSAGFSEGPVTAAETSTYTAAAAETAQSYTPQHEVSHQPDHVHQQEPVSQETSQGQTYREPQAEPASSHGYRTAEGTPEYAAENASGTFSRASNAPSSPAPSASAHSAPAPSAPAHHEEAGTGAFTGGPAYSGAAGRGTGSQPSDDYAAAIRNANPHVTFEQSSRPYAEPSSHRTAAGQKTPAAGMPGVSGSSPFTVPVYTQGTNTPATQAAGFVGHSAHQNQQQGTSPQQTVNSTRSKDLASMRAAGGRASAIPAAGQAFTGQTAIGKAPVGRTAVGRDTGIKTNFLTQRKIFGAEEIRIAGSSQKKGLGQAVDTTRLGQNVWHLYTSMGREAASQDNVTQQTQNAMRTAAMVMQVTKLRDGMTANTLRSINMNTMAAAYQSGRLAGMNAYLKQNGVKTGFDKNTFVGGRNQIRTNFDQKMNALTRAMQKDGFLRRSVTGTYVLTNPQAAAIRIFGTNATKTEQKVLQQLFSNQQAQTEFMRSHLNAKRMLVQNFVSMSSHQDPSISYMHQGYHMVRAGVQTYNLLRKAVVSDMKFTQGMFSVRGRYNRHQKAYEKIKQKTMAKSNMTSHEYREKLKTIEKKSRAELRNMNKKEVAEYKRLREARKQADWMNANRGRLHASKTRNAKIANIKKKVKDFNDLPVNFAKKQGRRLTNWARQTKAGTAITNTTKKISSAGTRIAEKFGNTRLGKASSAVKKFFGKANGLAAQIRKRIQAALNAIKKLLVKFLLVYVGVVIFIGIFVLFVLMPLTTNISMFVNDQKDMVDEASSAESISGKVYSELRYMEIQWASDIRSYGTQKNPIKINNSEDKSLLFTDQKLTAEEYLNSEEGIKDLLGAYAYEDGKKDDSHSGVQGPAPFAGAKLDDYKVIKQIDGGNVLELEGKPQEGWTSNSKEIIAMSTVFYSQCVDEVTTDTSDAVSAWNSFWDAAETEWHRVGTLFEVKGVPILKWIAGGTDWSYTGLYRNYAYPLALSSHLENYYLSTYIYPTKWTAPELANSDSEDPGDDADATNNATSASHEKSEGHTDARYDSNQEEKSAGPGDVLLNSQWGVSRNAEAKHGKLGIGKDGGSGKVDSKNRVSKGVWGSLGDDSYQGFETCEDAIGNTADRNIYNGYGCMLRYRFSYKWNGSFGTDEDGNVLDQAAVEASGLNTLHYGEADSWNEPNEGDGEGEDENNNNVAYNKTGGDVSADVSPYYENEDVARGYQKNSCLVYPLKLTGIAWSCWEETGTTEINMTEGGGYHPEWKLWQKSFDDKNRQKHFTHGDSDWAIDKIVTTGEGFDVYSFRIPRDEDGNILFDEATDATVFHLRHNCTGKHQGVYCGGHAQLRTRGIIYGLSKEQVTDQVLKDDEHSIYDPKFLDPDSKGKDEEFYGSALTVRNEAVSEFDAESLPDTDRSQILDDDAEYVKNARDLYDIDVLITRPKDMYPQTEARSTKTVIKRTAEAYLSLNPFVSSAIFIWGQISDAPKSTQVSDTTTNTEPWKSWTLTNMSQVTEMINQNWHDMYQVVDTQTIVGGQDGVNSLDDDMMNNVLDQLGWNDVANSIDFRNAEAIKDLVKQRNGKNAVVNGKELSIEEEMKYVNRLRHLKYAMSLVGKVSYSQDEHDKLWGNLSGHMTDCSGFASNVWRDALSLTGGYGAMSTSGLKAYAGSALHEYTGADTDGIEPGDIILKNPDDIGGSAHALIYVGKLDSSKLYLDREATNDDGTEYKYYNDDGTLKYGGEGGTQVYAIDCSTMTITTDTYAENAPNTLKEYLTDPSWDTFKGLIGKNNSEPDGGVQKARSGNVRFSAKSYLNDNSAGYGLYYIDMDQLARDKGVYTTGSDGTLVSKYGTFWEDFANYQSAAKSAENPSAEESTSQSEQYDAHLGQFKEAIDNFWDKDTSLGTELDRRQTVAISSSVGEEEKKAADWEVTDPPIPSEPNVEDPQDYDDFDWQDYADKLPEGDFKKQLQALIDYYGDSQWAKYYSSGLIKIRKTSDGQMVFYEEQAASWNGKTIAYGTAVAGSDSTNTVARRGCFLYALSAALTAKTGKIYTVQETIEECGGTLKWNSNGTLKMSGLGTVGGSIDKLNANTQNTGLGGNYTSQSNVSLSKIDEGLKQGKVYCVWSTTDSDPKGTLHNPGGAGMHWTAIIGRTSSGNYIVACNGDRGMEISPSKMPKYFKSCAEIS